MNKTSIKSRFYNNFDFLRFVFAVLVVVSHSYPLSGVSGSNEWIYKLTNGQMYLSDIGLNGFFIISGFFIYKSFARSESLKIFLKKRFLRLFPALFVVLLLALIITPFLYNHATIPFYKNTSYYTYLPYNLLLYGFQGTISGVFDANPYHAVNGSLWTIRYEFSLYMAIAFLFLVKTNQKLMNLLVVGTFVLLLVVYNCFLPSFKDSSVLGMLGLHILNLGSFFVAGTLMAVFNLEKIKSKQILVIIIFTLLCISVYFEVYEQLKHILLTAFVIFLGYSPIRYIASFGKFGDASYGIYIYSFFVQQILMHFYKLNTINLIVFSIGISIILGYLSWHLVEKRALKFKIIQDR